MERDQRTRSDVPSSHPRAARQGAEEEAVEGPSKLQRPSSCSQASALHAARAPEALERLIPRPPPTRVGQSASRRPP